MGGYLESVLAWEERHVERLADKRWFAAFRHEFWELAHERGLRGILSVRSYRTKNGRRRSVVLFGREHLLKGCR